MTQQKQTTQIHPNTTIGTATLAVADLDRALAFYEEKLGMQRIDVSNRTAIIGAGDQPILTLNEKPNAIRQPEYSTGLYHIAILLPSRADLARLILHIAHENYQLQGYSDHLVSEAFYLADPDGNGLELYRDRPRDEWKWSNGALQMANAPIDLDDFFAEAGENPVWENMPAGTKIGHIHLRVRNVDEAVKFYHDVLGFDLTATMPSAAFISAGGYHHHLGMNIWHSRGANPPPVNSVGLEEFSIVLPNNEALASISARIDDANLIYSNVGNDVVLADPSGNKVRLTSAT